MSSSSSPAAGSLSVIVLHDYTYEKSDGTPICIVKDELFGLVDQTNDSWWRVKPLKTTTTTTATLTRRPTKGFYVPAKYVKIVNDENDEAEKTGVITADPPFKDSVSSQEIDGGEGSRLPRVDGAVKESSDEESKNDEIRKTPVLDLPTGKGDGEPESSKNEDDDDDTSPPSAPAPAPAPAPVVDEAELSFSAKKKNFESMFGASVKKSKSKVSPLPQRRQFVASEANEGGVASWLKKDPKDSISDPSASKNESSDIAVNQSTNQSTTSKEEIRLIKDGKSLGVSPMMHKTQPSSVSPAALLVRSKLDDCDAQPSGASKPDDGVSQSTSVEAVIASKKENSSSAAAAAAASVEASVPGNPIEAMPSSPTAKEAFHIAKESLKTSEEIETKLPPATESQMITSVNEPSDTSLQRDSSDQTTAVIPATGMTGEARVEPPEIAKPTIILSTIDDAPKSKIKVRDAEATAQLAKLPIVDGEKELSEAESGVGSSQKESLSESESGVGSSQKESPSESESGVGSSQKDSPSESEAGTKMTRITSFSSPEPTTATLSFSASNSPDIVATASEILSSPIFTSTSGQSAPVESVKSEVKSQSDASCSVASLASTFEGRFKPDTSPAVVSTSKAVDPSRGKVSATAAKLRESIENALDVETPRSHQDGEGIVNANAAGRPHDDSLPAARPRADSLGNSFVNPLFVPPSEKPAPSKQNDVDNKPVMRRQNHSSASVRVNAGSQLTSGSNNNNIADELKKIHHRKSCMTTTPIGNDEAKPVLRKRNSADSITAAASEAREREEIHLTPGWMKVYDQQSRADVYVHDHSTTRWLSDHSPDGRIYFYSENREQSTWKLPEVHPPPPPSVATSDSEDSVQRLHFASPSSSVEELLDDDDRLASIGEDEDDDRANHHNNDPNNNDVVRYKGWLNFAKLPYDCSALSSKKSVKKNWAKGYVMLVSQWLVFYQSQKRSKAVPNHPFGKYDCKYKILGASISDGKDKTRKPSAILVSIDDKDGSVLLQNDDPSIMDKWRDELKKATTAEPAQQTSGPQVCVTSPHSSNPVSPNQDVGSFVYAAQTPTMTDLQKHLQASLPSSFKQQQQQPPALQLSEQLQPPPTSAKSCKDNHSDHHSSRKSIFRKKEKPRSSSGGNGDSQSGAADIGTRLDSWFRSKRPSIHDVKEKGIHKGGNVFGADLDQLIQRDAAHMQMNISSSQTSGTFHLVPAFVSKCIEALESRALLTTDGLYRINGNCAEIQRLRFLVDSEKHYDLTDSRWDCHVLTGSLKLFFRELMHPLIPWAAFLAAADLLKGGGAAEDKAKAARVKKITLEKMSDASFSTLRFLLSHLIRVAAAADLNRMQASNLGIVFGPTLMWSEAEMAAPGNMAFNMTFQSKLVEFMLSNFTRVFA